MGKSNISLNRMEQRGWDPNMVVFLRLIVLTIFPFSVGWGQRMQVGGGEVSESEELISRIFFYMTLIHDDKYKCWYMHSCIHALAGPSYSKLIQLNGWQPWDGAQFSPCLFWVLLWHLCPPPNLHWGTLIWAPSILPSHLSVHPFVYLSG